MIYTATVTQKGQVTIPIAIRKYLGIKPYEKVHFKKVKDIVVVNKSDDFWALQGSIKTKKKFDDDEADKLIGEYIAKQYAKKVRRSRR